MVTAVFVLGTLNLCLGVALAVAIDRVAQLPVPNLPELLKRLAARAPRGAEPPGVDDVSHVQDSPPEPSTPAWAAVLAQEQVATSSPLEDLLWVTKLQTQRMRSNVVAFAPEPGTDVVDAEGLRPVVSQWSGMLGEFVRLATEYKEQSMEIGARLEECLLDQAFELQSMSAALASESEVAQRLHSLIDAANVLRDDTDELIVAWKTEQGRLGNLPERFKAFGKHNTLTRLGIEELFAEWWSNDPERLRLVSLVLVDLDRFAKLNKAAGPGLADIAIEGIAEVLHGSVRKDRGFDRVGRVRADRYLLFLGDTSAKNAAKGADRIRQTIEASSCRFGEESMPMTASCAVIEVGKDETPAHLLKRLGDVIGEAKKAGRNLTFCDAGSGPAVVELPQYEVLSKDLHLDAP